jgi:hypothetical protein
MRVTVSRIAETDTFRGNLTANLNRDRDDYPIGAEETP